MIILTENKPVKRVRENEVVVTWNNDASNRLASITYRYATLFLKRQALATVKGSVKVTNSGNDYKISNDKGFIYFDYRKVARVTTAKDSFAEYDSWELNLSNGLDIILHP